MKRQFSGNFTEDQKRLFFFFWTIIKGKFVSAYHAQQSVSLSLLLFLGISPSPSMSCLRVWLASKSHGMTIGGGWKQWVSQDFEVFVCVCVCVQHVSSGPSYHDLNPWIPNIPVSYWIWQTLLYWRTGCDAIWLHSYSQHWNVLLLLTLSILCINKSQHVTTCHQQPQKYYQYHYWEILHCQCFL